MQLIARLGLTLFCWRCPPRYAVGDGAGSLNLNLRELAPPSGCIRAPESGELAGCFSAYKRN